MPNKDEFSEVYARLTALFRPVAANLTITEDGAGHCAVMGPATAKYPQGTWLGAVRIGKAYVSYHLVPVYMFPDLLAGISDRLRKRMQGKGCFNFTAVDEDLLAELAQLTATGVARFWAQPGR